MFSQALKQLRKEHHISQKQLGESIGVLNTTVSNWEQGLSSPDYPTLLKLSDFFAVSADALLGHTPGSSADAGGVARGQQAVSWALEDEQYEYMTSAHEHSEAQLLSRSEKLTNAFLRQQLLDCFDSLSRLGKLEAVKRLGELELLEPYHSTVYQQRLPSLPRFSTH